MTQSFRFFNENTSNKADEHIETIRIPIREEHIEIVKHPIDLEEVSIYKRRLQVSERVDENLKKERLHIKTIGDSDIKDKETE